MADKEFFEKYIKIFLTQNAKLNLISKNDEKYLWEKHIFDSLSIEQFFKTVDTPGVKLLDIGTGGGFPAVPIALSRPEIEVYALDSIRKKINAVENIKHELQIKNLHTICDRAENIKEQFDVVTSRAVASLKVISGYALPLLKQGGYFIAYKSRKVEEEISEAEDVLHKYHAKIVEIISYELPLAETHTRNLVVVKKGT